MTPINSNDIRLWGRGRGFTLIELMIVVAVVALLAAVALPSFMSQVRASRRSEAVATLAQIQQAQERWRANCTCYASSLTAANSGCPATDCATTSGLGLTLSSSRYSFSMTVLPASVTPNSYTITATGLGSQASDRATGASCTTLTVAVTNGQPVNSPAACWRQ
jgi:type IV pilus assembly protein PilE